MIDDLADATWDRELDDLFLRIGHRFGRADLRRRMRDYVRALLGPVGRKNGWQLAEHAGHRTPDGLQRLLNGATWEADAVRDDLQTYVADTLGEDDGVLIVDDTGFVKKGTTSAGVQRQYSGTAGRTEQLPDRRLRRLRHLPGPGSGRPRAVSARVVLDRRPLCRRAAKIPDERAFATKPEL
ncbi:transposase, partial [Streptomyces canarius]